MPKNVAKRYVAFTTLTYPEDPGYDAHFSRCEWEGWPYVYVIHDSDIKEDGTPDKPHCQSIIRTPNGMTVTAFAKKMGLEERFVRPLPSWRGYCDYLLHIDSESVALRKHRYSVDTVCGSMVSEFRQVVANRRKRSRAESSDDDLNIQIVLRFLSSSEYEISYTDLVAWASAQGLYSCVRRSSYIIGQLLKEHNNSVYRGRNRDAELEDAYSELRSVRDRALSLDLKLRRVSNVLDEVQRESVNPFLSREEECCLARPVDVGLIRDIVNAK